jgi:hypothetical protein
MGELGAPSTAACQWVLLQSMTLSVTSSWRIQAVSVRLACLPQPRSCKQRVLMARLPVDHRNRAI